MSFTENDIAYENGNFWVLKLDKNKGFQVLKSGITHSAVCDRIGYCGEKGLSVAIEKCDNRANKEIMEKQKETSKN